MGLPGARFEGALFLGRKGRGQVLSRRERKTARLGQYGPWWIMVASVYNSSSYVFGAHFWKVTVNNTGRKTIRLGENKVFYWAFWLYLGSIFLDKFEKSRDTSTSTIMARGAEKETWWSVIKEGFETTFCRHIYVHHYGAFWGKRLVLLNTIRGEL